MHEFSDGSRRPVCYVSRSLAKAESHYSQIERQALAIVFAVKRLHSYLYGHVFKLRTDLITSRYCVYLAKIVDCQLQPCHVYSGGP